MAGTIKAFIHPGQVTGKKIDTPLFDHSRVSNRGTAQELLWSER